MTHRGEERNTGVDVNPGEEDGEGGVERASCKKLSAQSSCHRRHNDHHHQTSQGLRNCPFQSQPLLSVNLSCCLSLSDNDTKNAEMSAFWKSLLYHLMSFNLRGGNRRGGGCLK